MRGSFERTTSIGASPGRVWATLHDVNLLASFSSHLGHVTTVEPDRSWNVNLQDHVGPLRLSAPMQVEILEETEEVEISIRASGKDRGPGTLLVVEATMRLDQAEDGVLTLSGRFDLTGKVVRFGAAVAKRQADRMIDEFWSNLTKVLQA